MSPAALTIALDDRRRHFVMWSQKLQHAVGGVPLLLAGVQRVSSPGGIGDLFAYAEIIVAGVLLAMLARDLRGVVSHRKRGALARLADEAAPPEAHVHHDALHRGHGHAGPEWFDVVAGAMLIVEAVHAASLGGKPFYARPNFLLGVVTLAVGLLHGPLSRRAAKRREIRFDASGIHARLSRFRSFSVPWSDVRAIRVADGSAIIDAASSTHTINLHWYRNASEIRSALDTWSRARLPPASS